MPLTWRFPFLMLDSNRRSNAQCASRPRRWMKPWNGWVRLSISAVCSVWCSSAVCREPLGRLLKLQTKFCLHRVCPLIDTFVLYFSRCIFCFNNSFFLGTTSPVLSILPQNTVTRTPAATTEATPVIANVISLSSAPNGQPGILGNAILQGDKPFFKLNADIWKEILFLYKSSELKMINKMFCFIQALFQLLL